MENINKCIMNKYTVFKPCKCIVSNRKWRHHCGKIMLSMLQNSHVNLGRTLLFFSGSFHDGMPIHTSFVSFFNTLSSYTSFKIFFPTFWTGQRASITQNWRYWWYSYSCIFTQYSRPCILYVAIFIIFNVFHIVHVFHDTFYTFASPEVTSLASKPPLCNLFSYACLINC